MEITLEMIDQVRQRTGVTVREAKEALEKCGGNVIEALCYLEEKNPTITERIQVAGGEIRDKVAGLLKQGNITRITVKKNGRAMVEIPVALGALGALLLPELAALGVLLALAGDYTLEVERRPGETASRETDPPTDGGEADRSRIN